MNYINVFLIDGSSLEMESGCSALDVAKKISSSLAKKSIAVKVDGILRDVTYILESDCKLEIITIDSDEAFAILNHSAAHLMAAAILKLYPEAKFAYGPAIKDGFYYDFEVGATITENDLPKVEKEMQKLIKQNYKFERSVQSREDLKEMFNHDEYKTVLIDKIPEGEVLTTYKSGEFVDLCAGVHVPSFKWLKNFKLLSVAGAYFQGDSNNNMLTRIYGICFATSEGLQQHLDFLIEAEKRDHRKLGKQLGLFMMADYAPGCPFFLPNGMILKSELLKYWEEEHLKLDYKLIQTPIMMNRDLWEISGHWFNYKENMYTSEIDKYDFAIKPMNCPGALLVYKDELHSYRQLPLRIGELGHVHRHEFSGALHGLMRVRAFTQDDAHIFMAEDQIVDSIIETVKLFEKLYKTFNLDFNVELSTKPEKAIGSDDIWEKAEKALEEALKAMNYDYKINEGDGAFYGPKIDFKLLDAIGRVWQCGTIQLDFNLPERFDLVYIDETGKKVRPVMIHRALYGSIERFIGILIEHYAGIFPLWLAPLQVQVIPVSNSIHADYANAVVERMKEEGIRVDIDIREEKLGRKMRDAQMKKTPYTLVLGDNEKENNTVNYRCLGSEEQTELDLESFITKIKNEIDTKKQ